MASLLLQAESLSVSARKNQRHDPCIHRGITMKNLVDHLSQYAAYHRDTRNIVTHFVGIPLIVIAVAVLLSRPGPVGRWAGFGCLPRCW
jgi:predicted membrane channel-forming protein YqfA (hemolysin III family)